MEDGFAVFPVVVAFDGAMKISFGIGVVVLMHGKILVINHQEK